MDLTLAGVGAAVIAEGITFLYGQAGELLKRWREGGSSSEDKPKVLPPPAGVIVGRADPLSAPLDATMVESLTTLRSMLGSIRAGDLDDKDVRASVATMRDLLEVALKTRITFAGEAPRPELTAKDVTVTVERVSGSVAGLRANLQKLTGKVAVGDVIVQAGDVEPGGQVTGLDLT
jgi:hypothetical protein